jgi:AcrR family transcriptional regulator
MSPANSPFKKIDRARDRELKRDAVIAAGAAAFSERGYHNTSLDDIAARLNVSKPTVYYYVKNKEQILSEIFRVGLERLDVALSEAHADSRTAVETLGDLVRRYVELMATDYGRCIVRVSDNELSPEVGAEFRAIKRATHRRMQALIEQGVAEGSLSAPDPKLTAFALAGALNWVAIWYEPSRGVKPEDIVKAFGHLFGEGLKPR